MRSSISLVYVSHSLADIGRIEAVSSLMLHFRSRSNGSFLERATYCSPNECSSTDNLREPGASAVVAAANAVPIEIEPQTPTIRPRPTVTKPNHRLDLPGYGIVSGR